MATKKEKIVFPKNAGLLESIKILEKSKVLDLTPEQEYFMSLISKMKKHGS